MLKEIFEEVDKYQEKILRREDFVMSLRTDERVIGFIGDDVVRERISGKILTMDDVLTEVEKDEFSPQDSSSGAPSTSNPKEYITLDEFLSYFENFQPFELRHKKDRKFVTHVVQNSPTKQEEFDESALLVDINQSQIQLL